MKTYVEHEHVTAELVRFANAQLIAGAGCEVDADTPVLEMGVLDSLAMVALLTHIHSRLGVAIPDEEVLPENFETFGKLADLVARVRDSGKNSAETRSTSALEESVRMLEGSGI